MADIYRGKDLEWQGSTEDMNRNDRDLKGHEQEWQGLGMEM